MKKRQRQTGHLPRPPTSPDRSQSLRAGWPPVCSSTYQVLLKSVQWFCRCGWSKIALFPLLWPLAYTTACTTVQAVIKLLGLLLITELATLIRKFFKFKC